MVGSQETKNTVREVGHVTGAREHQSFDVKSVFNATENGIIDMRGHI